MRYSKLNYLNLFSKSPTYGGREVEFTFLPARNNRFNSNTPNAPPVFHIQITVAAYPNSGGSDPSLLMGNIFARHSVHIFYISSISQLELPKPISQIHATCGNQRVDDMLPRVRNTNFDLNPPAGFPIFHIPAIVMVESNTAGSVRPLLRQDPFARPFCEYLIRSDDIPA